MPSAVPGWLPGNEGNEYASCQVILVSSPLVRGFWLGIKPRPEGGKAENFVLNLEVTKCQRKKTRKLFVAG